MKTNLTHEQREAQRIGALIQKNRIDQGWTQQQLSDAVNRYPGGENCYRQVVSDFERGKRLPSIPELRAITQAFGQNCRDWL